MSNPMPYMGKDKYIFISYSHKDTNEVFPIISKLIDNGYRVWFDQGIDPGSEWDENIAQHVKDCGYFISFMSNNYINSSNCKDELNFARDLEKERLIVYLEEVELPSGLAMRVNRLQSIFKHAYANIDDFYSKLFSAQNIDICLDNTKQAQDATIETVAPVQPVAAAVPSPAQVHTVAVSADTDTKKGIGALHWVSWGLFFVSLFSVNVIALSIIFSAAAVVCAVLAVRKPQKIGWRISTFIAFGFSLFFLSILMTVLGVITMLLTIGIDVAAILLLIKLKK